MDIILLFILIAGLVLLFEKKDKERKEFNKEQLRKDSDKWVEEYRQKKLAETQDALVLELATLREESITRLNEEVKVKSDEVAEEITRLSVAAGVKLEEINRLQLIVNAINENLTVLEEDKGVIEYATGAVNDIELLTEISFRLTNREAVGKLIYDVYIKPPLEAMMKRDAVADVSGIYKITDEEGRGYIGKSVKIKNRWRQHCKSALGVGTISHSQIHDMMAKKGICNFRFEVLEYCDKDSLNEREKFYIDFYNTKEKGYNMRVGG